MKGSYLVPAVTETRDLGRTVLDWKNQSIIQDGKTIILNKADFDSVTNVLAPLLEAGITTLSNVVKPTWIDPAIEAKTAGEK